MTYTPNFNDPRVKNKITKALGWVSACLSTTKPRAWSKLELDRRFGTQNHQISSWLRSQLLITASHQYNMNTGVCKTYLLNEQGWQYLSGLYQKPQVAIEQAQEWAEQEHLEELRTGEFEYKDKSHRLWNDLQRMPQIIRKPLFARFGYRYEYDIQACAPTLIYQHALRAGLTRPTPYLTEFLRDRDQFRQRLQQDIGCDPAQSKRIITSLFSGARLGYGNAISAILNHNRPQVSKLSSLTYIKALQKDIKKCWDKIKVYEEKLKLSSRDKWMIYFQLERSVLEVIKRYLKKHKVKYFLEHDGWRCDAIIDPLDLRDLVKGTLNYDIMIELSICEG